MKLVIDPETNICVWLGENNAAIPAKHKDGLGVILPEAFNEQLQGLEANKFTFDPETNTLSFLD